jgi:hypothetical protein
MRSALLALTIFCACLARTEAAEPVDATMTADTAMTAGDLQQLCMGDDHVSINVCRVFILGVTQGIAVGLDIAAGKASARNPCVPRETSAEALEETVKARLGEDLAAHPADAHRDASGFIAVVLAEKYPCRKSH